MDNFRRRVSDSGTISEGVWAYYSDGSVKDYAHADSSAIGVAVITENCSFVIDKTDVDNSADIYYGGYNVDLSGIGVFCEPDYHRALLDFDGENNTTKIINALSIYSDDSVKGAHAAIACRNLFGVVGYMGSLGEWNEAAKNKESINDMMSKIGGTIPQGYYWTTTLYNEFNTAYIVNYSYIGEAHSYRINGHLIRAFRAL